MAAAPMWHFGRPRGFKPCYPQDAVQNGVQTDGNAPDFGFRPLLNNGCSDPGEWNGPNSQGNPFPIYFSVTQCQPHEYRVTYSIYFRHDSGHKSDWENVAVVWQGDENNQWYRARLLIGQHGRWVSLNWGDIQGTVNGWEDLMDQDAKYRNHPKVYVGVFSHAVFHTRKTNFDLWNPADQDGEFRSNDWYLFPWDDLVQRGDMIKREWSWGKADTNPPALVDQSSGKWICNA
ncbi:hypothetical protein BDZ91DRAFT_657955 [Kalaharituber pfeilii]|nr:hypothetical protein BDZ91DRAFT_657955 [Kalaharituber pfeilii]